MVSNVKPELFQKIPTLGLVVNQVNNTLLAHLRNSDLGQSIWDTLNTVISFHVLLSFDSRIQIFMLLCRQKIWNQTRKRETFGRFTISFITSEKEDWYFLHPGPFRLLD
jgi:uncharacterized membrane protein YczE